MRIALVTPGFSRDAGEWAIPALQHLAVRLNESHDLTIFSLRYPPRGQYRVGPLTHHATGGGTRFGPASAWVVGATVLAIARAHLQRRFDVIHAFWADEAGLVAVTAAALLRRPALLSLGGGELTYLPEIDYGIQRSSVRGRLVDYALRRAAMVTVGSAYQAALVRALGLHPRLVPLGVDVDHFRPRPTVSLRQPTLIQVASLVPVKGQGLLLDVLTELRKRLAQVRLLVVGDGPLGDELRRQAAGRGLLHQISWPGAIPHLATNSYYRRAHLYLQTSRHESQGMAVVEALACGLPVLGTPVGLLPEVACAPATADPAGLASAVVTTLTSPARYAALRQAARQLAVERFSLERSAAVFSNLYRRLVGSG